jgi:Insertion element 4 transposase N-terminal/Transposase DDE domain
MVDAVLAETGRVQSRIRALPSRVVVYLLLAGCLFADLGYGQVWQRLVAGLEGIPVPAPTQAALTKARRRVGATPLQALFDLLRGPATAIAAGGVRWRGLLVCAIDGTTISVADTAANLDVFCKQAGHHGGWGYPLLRLLALVACGTRSIIDAVVGPTSSGETAYAQRLLGSLHAGMIVLCDRNFAAGKLIAAIAATKAHVLVRCKQGRKLAVLARFPDGSYRSLLGAVAVRVIDAEITIATSTGRRSGVYRLATTLLDHHRYPAVDLVRLYHQRWEIEMCQPQCTHICGLAA